MPTVTSQLEAPFRSAIREALGLDADPLIAPSQNEKFGDYQSNAAMGLAKLVTEKTGQKTNPRAIAEQVKAKLNLGDMASEVSIAGPGFINVRLSPDWLEKALTAVGADPRLGVEQTQTPLTVVVDYSGPNIAKEMHVGHLRGTILGDCFVRTLSFLGHHVIRQNHIGDWGLQMGMVTHALEQDGRKSVTLADLDQMYKRISQDNKDPAVRRQMAERTSVLQGTPKSQLTTWRQVRELTLSAVHEMYRRMDVLLGPDDVRGESDYSDIYPAMVADLIANGTAQETEGAIGIFPPGFLNREGQPRAFIIKSRDGSYQYPTFDLAALSYRIRTLHAQRIIYTHDDRQAEHFAMLFAVARQLGLDRGVQLDYAPFGTLLGEDGKPLKSRSGDNVKLTELLDEAEQRGYQLAKEKDAERVQKAAERGEHLEPLPESSLQQTGTSVGIGAIKYADLSKDRTSDYIFSFSSMLSLDGNTAPYLQYAHARIRSIFRRAVEQGASAGALQLQSPFELALAKHVLRLTEVVELVARDLKPHLLCTYLYDLATKFSAFYENCPVLKSEAAMRSSRLTLCDITGKTLALGLELLGIEHPEEM